MGLHEKIKEETVQALRAGDARRVRTLRLLLASIQNEEIRKRSKSPGALKEEDLMSLVRREVKKRKEAIEFAKKGNRSDIADEESAELVILEAYLPEGPKAEEITRVVSEAIQSLGASSDRDFGRIMKSVMGMFAGRADAESVACTIRSLLSGASERPEVKKVQ